MYKAQSSACGVTRAPHIVQGNHRITFEYGVVGGSVFFVRLEGKGTGDSILVTIICFAIDVGEVKREKYGAEQRRSAGRKQGLIPYDVGATIEVGDPGGGGGGEQKEGGDRERESGGSRYASREYGEVEYCWCVEEV